MFGFILLWNVIAVLSLIALLTMAYVDGLDLPWRQLIIYVLVAILLAPILITALILKAIMALLK